MCLALSYSHCTNFCLRIVLFSVRLRFHCTFQMKTKSMIQAQTLDMMIFRSAAFCLATDGLSGQSPSKTLQSSLGSTKYYTRVLRLAQLTVFLSGSVGHAGIIRHRILQLRIPLMATFQTDDDISGEYILFPDLKTRLNNYVTERH